MNDFEFRYPGPQILNMLKISYMPTSEILTEVLAFRWQQHDYTFLAVAEILFIDMSYQVGHQKLNHAGPEPQFEFLVFNSAFDRYRDWLRPRR